MLVIFHGNKPDARFGKEEISGNTLNLKEYANPQPSG
jgi:hypothetical protein